MANRIFILFSLILAIGIAAGGFAIGAFYYKSHEKRISSVSVKGIAEQDAEADYATWSLKFVAADNDLSTAQSKIESDRQKVIAFLMNNGIKENEITMHFFDVSDQTAQSDRDGPIENRYILTQILLVQTANLDAVEQAAKNIASVVNDGVIISSEQYSAGPNYIFSKLNDIKPAMIAEATRNARAAAQQFAKDSGAAISGIKSAAQGQFTINSPVEDEGAREIKYRHKKVRVVSTIEYYLE